MTTDEKIERAGYLAANMPAGETAEALSRLADAAKETLEIARAAAQRAGVPEDVPEHIIGQEKFTV